MLTPNLVGYSLLVKELSLPLRTPLYSLTPRNQWLPKDRPRRLQNMYFCIRAHRVRSMLLAVLFAQEVERFGNVAAHHVEKQFFRGIVMHNRLEIE